MTEHRFCADAGGSAAGPAQLFIYISSSAYFWYNTNLARSAHLEEQYWLAGWLLGQTLHNRTSFPLAASPVVTEKLILGSHFEVSHITMSCCPRPPVCLVVLSLMTFPAFGA